MNEETPPGRSDRLRLRAGAYALLEPRIGAGDQATDRRQNRASFLVEAVLVAVIVINSASLILWTVPGLGTDYDFWFHLVEHCTVAVILIEYGMRLWVAPEADRQTAAWRQRWRYVSSPIALVDAAAVAPSAVAALLLLVFGEGPSLSFLLSARLLTRTVKLARYFPGGRRLGVALRQKGSQLIAAIVGLLVVLVIAASLMYFAEAEAQPDVFSSIPAAMWWGVVTLTTVGYGDTVPVTVAGRLLAAVIAVLGIGLFALPAGIISAGMVEAEDDGAERGGRTPSILIAGAVCPHCGQPMPADPDSD